MDLKRTNRKYKRHATKLHAVADGCAIVAILVEIAKDVIVLGAVAALVILVVVALEA